MLVWQWWDDEDKSWQDDANMRGIEGELPAPSMVTLVGHTGRQATFMGTYERSTERRVNGSPLFVKMMAGGGEHFLYRNSGAGRWVVTDKESNIAENRGTIQSSTAADLPSEAGLAWKYVDSQGDWQDGAELRCT